MDILIHNGIIKRNHYKIFYLAIDFMSLKLVNVKLFSKDRLS